MTQRHRLVITRFVIVGMTVGFIVVLWLRKRSTKVQEFVKECEAIVANTQFTADSVRIVDNVNVPLQERGHSVPWKWDKYMLGKTLVLDGPSRTISEAQTQLPRNCRASLTDAEFTTVLILEHHKVEDHGYYVGGQSAWSEIGEIAYILWPAKICVGRERMTAGPPTQLFKSYNPQYITSASFTETERSGSLNHLIAWNIERMVRVRGPIDMVPAHIVEHCLSELNEQYEQTKTLCSHVASPPDERPIIAALRKMEECIVEIGSFGRTAKPAVPMLIQVLGLRKDRLDLQFMSIAMKSGVDKTNREHFVQQVVDIDKWMSRVCGEAGRALGKIGTDARSAMGPLADAAKDRNWFVKESALAAITQIQPTNQPQSRIEK